MGRRRAKGNNSKKERRKVDSDDRDRKKRNQPERDLYCLLCSQRESISKRTLYTVSETVFYAQRRKNSESAIRTCWAAVAVAVDASFSSARQGANNLIRGGA